MKVFFDKLFSGGFSFTYFSTPFENFRAHWWRDVLDILAIAVLLFALYLFIRDRRAGKLVIGIGMLLALYAASAALDMYAVRFVFSTFFSYGIIVLVVIFQPEIRAAMERMGSISFRGLKTIGVESKTTVLSPAAMDAVVEAVKDMSFSKTGALIVIEQGTKIGEYIRTGTTLNAELTPELLRAVFFDKAPLHDGAVIIRGGRLYAAGCYLPLSEKADIFKGLGTRHRAAVGLSEQSDSVIIVVSEETGTISVAYNGELFREFTSVSLRRKLWELLGKQNDAV
ncbi:MAG: TIGR00159 family protein [Ruminococcaceae bacterium]|nr:TIGR00159 family protein [Oscillospiraceae bacterium]